MRLFFAFFSLAYFLPSLQAQETAAVKLPPQILTNQGIIALSDAGYDEDFLIDLIQSRQTRFDISSEGLSYLAQHGLCEHVVRVMVARANTHEQHTAVAAPVLNQNALPPGQATVQAGVQMIPVAGTTWIHGAGFPVPQPPPVPYQVVRRRVGLFHHRWYLVQPETLIPATAYPMPARTRVPVF